MQIPKSEITQFQKQILSWYNIHKRDLPWRKTSDPYKILVSEIMSQQTQLARVVPKYEAWLQVFPSVNKLAMAKQSEVLRLWSGLGYNRRALYLQKCAQAIVHDHKGIFPKTKEQLQTLPGIGEYTAAAVSCFAFNKQIAVLDTNIRKVILINFKQYLAKDTPKALLQVAEQLLPTGKAKEWNQALMDYASAVLKKEKIPIPKQSTFKGSNRYYRGQIVKHLLTHHEVTIDELQTILQKDKEFLEKIVAGLDKDALVKKEGKIISLR